MFLNFLFYLNDQNVTKVVNFYQYLKKMFNPKVNSTLYSKNI